MIDQHSLTKHAILREYVIRYIRTLTRNPARTELRLTLVDGFAGGGRYRRSDGSLCDGSPLLLIKAVQQARHEVNLERTVRKLDIFDNYYFIDKDRSACEALQAALLEDPQTREMASGAEGLLSQVDLRQGVFREHAPDVISAIKASGGRTHRALFVLDQYGYTDVPLPIIRAIFDQLPEAEVFLTVAVGWIAAYASTPEQIPDLLRQRFQAEQAADVAPQEDVEIDLSDDNTRAKMREIARCLGQFLMRNSGALRYTPFFIVSSRSCRPYWLVHLANNAKANDVVKQLHWEKQNHFEHFGDPGMPMLGFDSRRDQLSLPFHFDEDASHRTNDRLLVDLPPLIERRFPDGISSMNLYGEVCNETPADAQRLFAAVRQLCQEKDLVFERIGADGEQRRLATAVQPKDIIRLRPQRAFSFLR